MKCNVGSQLRSLGEGLTSAGLAAFPALHSLLPFPYCPICPPLLTTTPLPSQVLISPGLGHPLSSLFTWLTAEKMPPILPPHQPLPVLGEEQPWVAPCLLRHVGEVRWADPWPTVLVRRPAAGSALDLGGQSFYDP